MAHAAFDFVLHHLIDDAKGGRVGERGEMRADAERIDGRAGAKEFRDLVLFEVAGGHDLCVAEARVVKDRADGFREREAVAGIEAHAP